MDAADAVVCRLALNRVPGVGPAIQTRLLNRFGGAEAVFGATESALAECLAGVPGAKPVAAAIAAGPDLASTSADLEWLDASPRRHLLLRDQTDYPLLLEQIPDPPPLLFLDGDPGALRSPQVAVVGSRSCSALGREIAKELAAGLAQAGIAVTSGLATGIDTAAHLGALDAGGVTLAVAGNGLDTLYPRSAAPLAERIRSDGALLSEFPIGTRPHRAHFPRRNRIISGLSLATLVVEADQRSGSLITARLAAEQGRDVFAVPGSVRNPRARGCHALIRDGATLVQNAAEVIEGLAPQLRPFLSPATVDTPAPQTAPADSFLDALGHEPFSLDDAVASSGLTPAAVSTKLLRLELDGQIAPSPGGRFIRLR